MTRSITVRRPLVTAILPPRKSRHGKRIVMLAQIVGPEGCGWSRFDPKEEGIRVSNSLRVASGPTILKGKQNLPPINAGGKFIQPDGTPEWWKPILKEIADKRGKK